MPRGVGCQGQTETLSLLSLCLCCLRRFAGRSWRSPTVRGLLLPRLPPSWSIETPADSSMHRSQDLLLAESYTSSLPCSAVAIAACCWGLVYSTRLPAIYLYVPLPLAVCRR